ALSDLAAAGTLTTAPFGGTVSAGNPNLRPFMADSLETSFDYYDDHRGYASVGVFYKNMESFITSQTTVEPYSATGFPVSFLLPGQSPSIPYNYTAPINGKGAVIVGLEAAGQRDFDFLPAPFNHLGMEGNVTYADGSTPITFSGTPIRLPLSNLSKLTTNVTLYYEEEVWGVRVSDAYRSRYLDGASGNGNIGDFINSSNNVDMQAHYNITPDLKLVFEGLNLTDQPIVQYVDVTAKRPEVYTRSGQTFTFGATYNF
ncbi:MAG TPA: TonB-dependent receptor, partial [Rhizomicrobium sp.]|nr:TonB-dependent receptor [Rhizomicrobium sp.]